MGKRAVILALALLAAGSACAQQVPVRVVATSVKPNAGAVYLAVFGSAEGWRKNAPVHTMKLQCAARIVEAALALPPGEYVFSLYQDLNHNEKLDTNFIGIPREPVGISNYDGKGPPGGFNKQKVRISEGGIVLEIRLITISP